MLFLPLRGYLKDPLPFRCINQGKEYLQLEAGYQCVWVCAADQKSDEDWVRQIQTTHAGSAFAHTSVRHTKDIDGDQLPHNWQQLHNLQQYTLHSEHIGILSGAE